MKNKIDIRPTTGVYATYKRLSYQPWTAIAEFVDNSTQSYFDHKEELQRQPNFEQLKISIVYEAKDNSSDILTITDNAFGMELEDFERAIQLDKVPNNTSGRNEFGMGLKTAACWFGSRWSVISTKLGSCNGYRATLDVNRLAESKEDSIDLDIFESTPEEHYTIIRIENLNKKITGPRTIGKVKKLLSSTYRQDIRSGDISITYGDVELTYKEPVIYEEILKNDEKKVWKKEIDFSVLHDNNILHCHGFVALRIPASLQDAGFTLMRRGRVIVGGPEENYRPKELFGDYNSYEYQRLFGEIHMDNWPVTQAKDDFDWHNSGLEESFIKSLQPLIKEYRQKAGSLRVRQPAETGKERNQTVKDFQPTRVITDISASSALMSKTIPVRDSVSKDTGIENAVSEIVPKADGNKNVLPEIEGTVNSNNVEVKINGHEKYNMFFHYTGKDFLFEVIFDSSNSLGQWVNVRKKSEVNYQITINLKHVFFKPFTENKDFLSVITKLIIAMVLAEIDAIFVSKDGRIDASDIRRNMNNILEKIALGGMQL